jgi:hypothetical protein
MSELREEVGCGADDEDEGSRGMPDALCPFTG